MLLRSVTLALCATLCVAVPSNVIRPCNLAHYSCIGQNLAVNSHCNRNVKGSLPSQYTIPEFKFDTPSFNATYIDKGLIIRNHDKCVVSEFFFNRQTDTSVLTIDCALLDFESDRDMLQHSTASEDFKFSYHIRGTYPLIRFTTTLSHADKINLCDSFTFADVTALPFFHVDPKDKPTANYLSRDLSLLNIYERETFFWRAPQIARKFINSYICDFGCE